jgi:radical SAM protein (TIGR01212 family)
MYLSLSTFLRSRFHERVQKIALDAGFTCPNRDGSKGTGGCLYCDSRGSGTGAWLRGIGIEEQMREGMAWAGRRYGARKFIAYFQAFSNTYGPLTRLEELYRQALVGPEVVGLSIGTRPDCVDNSRLDLIAQVGEGRMLWMEYGLQSASDETLRRIRRGHTVSAFVRAVEQSRSRGMLCCAHVIFGLPGEGRSEMEETVRLLADMRIEGVKFHQLFVVRGSALQELYEAGLYRPLDQEEYADLVARALLKLPKDTVIQRLTGDPPPGALVAPDWSQDKAGTIALITRRAGEIEAGKP